MTGMQYKRYERGSHSHRDIGAQRPAGTKPSPMPRPNPFVLERFDTIDVSAQPEWLVDGILPARGFGVTYGATGSAKTFFLSHAGYSITSGHDWAGRGTKTGAVVFLAAEGAAGFRKRIVAHRHCHGISQPIPFFMVASAPDLGHSPGDVDRLIESIGETIDGPVSLIVGDTLARCMHGADENSAADMSIAITNGERLQNAFDCLFIFSHHPGKDTSKGARGSSVLKAAADVEIHVEQIGDLRRAEITKAKDAESGLSMEFKLKQYEFIANDQAYSSCVVDVTRDWGWVKDPETKSTRKPQRHAAHLLQIVQNTLADLSTRAPRELGLPFGTPVVTREQVSAEALKARFVGAEKEDKNAFRAQLSRALSSLAGDRFIGMRDDWIWVGDSK
jgi:hypothetical protein